MQKETALSRVRAAMQRNPLILIMCALSVCVQTTAAPTSAPIAGSFAYRCARYQVDCATPMQLAAFASGCFLLLSLFFQKCCSGEEAFVMLLEVEEEEELDGE